MEQEGEKRGGFEDCSGAVIGACIEVHRHLGPGLLAQLLTYLKLTGMPAGLLVNFRETMLKHRLKRVIRGGDLASERS